MTDLAASAPAHARLPAIVWRGSPLPRLLQVALYAVILLYGIFFTFTRGLGAGALLATTASVIVLWVPIFRRYVQPPLVALAIVGAIYVALSYTGALHWHTLLFERYAIPQQAFYIFMLPPLITIFAQYHERVFVKDRLFVILDHGILLACVVSKAYTAYAGRDLAALGVVQLLNVEAIFAFLIVRRIFYSPHLSAALRYALVLVIFLSAGSFQSLLISLFLLGLLIAPRLSAYWLAAYVLGLLLVSVVAVPFARDIWFADPNTGIRLYFWRDAIERVILSGGVGEGFGTETIRPYYDLLTTDVVISGLDTDGFIMVGSHNAFVDAAYRLGVLGLIILGFQVGRQIYRVVRARSRGTMFDSWVAACLFTILMVNVGLASINFLLGSAFLMGWLAFRISHGFASRSMSPALGR